MSACGINQGVVLMHYLTVLLMLALCCSVLYAESWSALHVAGCDVTLIPVYCSLPMVCTAARCWDVLPAPDGVLPAVGDAVAPEVPAAAGGQQQHE
jgi:hypothetical protein